MPYLCLWRHNFCAAGGALLWLQRCVFWTAKKSLFIDYSGAKYARFIPKNTVALKALFLVAENSGFAV
mgnify:CR=1 FL=1|jgi:hypothetical protein